MKLFRELSEDETKEFQKWARENYIPYSEIKGIWHPAVQAECVLINTEHDATKGIELTNLYNPYDR